MKKNLREIPKEVLTKIQQLRAADIVAGCAVKFTASALRNGVLKHLGITLTPKGLSFASPIIPPARQGKYSRLNVDGEIVVRKDLPMVTHYTSVETPNWGDPTNGYHTVDLPHQAYKRQFKPPREIDIAIHCATTQSSLPAYVISFKLNDTLRVKSQGFRNRLLEDLNILQENVGASGVQAATAPLESFAKSLHLSWEILPPGTKQEALDRLFRGRHPSKALRDVASDRYDFFLSLKPEKLVFGRSGFRRYFGALIKDDLVVFENIEYGNAIYVMFEQWEELSQRSRLELLSGKFGRAFQRVPHQPGWKSHVRSIVRAKAKPPRIPSRRRHGSPQ